MRKALRAGSIVVLSYLLQATLLPFLKVRGAQLDLISLMLFALGSVLGMYGGICCAHFRIGRREYRGLYNRLLCVGTGIRRICTQKNAGSFFARK